MTGVVVLIVLSLVYLLGRSHGAERTKKTVRGFFSDDKGRK